MHLDILCLLSFLALTTSAQFNSNYSTCVQRSLSNDFVWSVKINYGNYIEYGAPPHIMPSWAYVMFRPGESSDEPDTTLS